MNNKSIQLISKAHVGFEESSDTVCVYLLDEETYNMVTEIQYYTDGQWDSVFGKDTPVPNDVQYYKSVDEYIRDVLDIHDDSFVAPGALYHT